MSSETEPPRAETPRPEVFLPIPKATLPGTDTGRTGRDTRRFTRAPESFIAQLAKLRQRRIAIITAVALAALALAYYLADVLNPFLIALLIAYVLDPLVEWFERRRVRRLFAVSVLFGVVLVGVGTLVTVGIFSAADHLQELRLELTGERILDEKNPVDKDAIERLRKSEGPYFRSAGEGKYYYDEDGNGERKAGLIERIAANVGPRWKRIPQSWIEGVTKALEAQAGEAFSVGMRASSGLQTFILQVWNFFGYVILVPIYTFFLLLSLGRIRQEVTGLLPGRYRDWLVEVATELDRAIAAFFRGRLLIAIGKGLLTGLGLYLVGVRFAFFIGFLAGVLSIIPFAGFLVGGALAVAFAYQPESWGARCFGVLIVFVIAEVLEAVIYPLLIGRNVGLHPLVLILSVFCFGRLFGLFGILLAVPIACLVKIIFLELVLPHLQALAAEQPDPAPPVP